MFTEIRRVSDSLSINYYFRYSVDGYHQRLETRCQFTFVPEKRLRCWGTRGGDWESYEVVIDCVDTRITWLPLARS